jgi:hypothetical protein
MVINPQSIIQDFILALGNHCGVNLAGNAIAHNLITAPHQYPNLPSGQCAVYVFSLSGNSAAPAGPNCILKVGKAGPNFGPRFKYQHYNPSSAGSTFAGAIINNGILWDYLGIPQNINANNVGLWIQSNTDRDHFYLDSAIYNILHYLEVYVKGILGPAFEGS